MLKLKALLKKIVQNMDFTPIVRTWSNIATPKASTWYRLATFTIPANSQYLILGRSGNAKGGSVTCACSFNIVSGSGAKVWTEGSSASNAGSGNYAVGWAYIKTGATPYVIEVRNYSYDTSVTNCNGSAIAIPLFGGGTA